LLSGEYQKKIPVLDVYQLQIPKDLTVPEMLSVMRRNPDVEYAEPDYKTYICSRPDDTFFNYQYALLNTGQPIGPPGSITGKHGADIRATEGWDITVGDKSVVVAVVDTGIDRTHPDLQKNILTGGWNFIEDTDDVTDDNGHGTFISGVIAADTDNGIGISGVTWNCKILPIKGIDAQGEGYASAMIHAIIWATDQKVDIINMSVGADGPSRALKSALKYAFDHDIVIVSSSGNNHSDVAYPAAYDEYSLAVSATNYKDEFLDMSNRGPEIDVAAPGERIIGCVPEWILVDQAFPYEFWTGTSIAAAHVSGLAALIKSFKPWLTNTEIMNVIRYTADDVNSTEFSGKDNYIGYGRINIKKALVPTVLK
ncbi:MAG: S8 family serine peptidase, partial [Candidatus Aminicenantes bacterium]|nr:S8 family serine peptidase [Candidatus Aminicenantes bacterium]